MPLASGTRFGPYEVESPIGAGGMGQVYRARDTRLGRAVAIKVLADGLASDAASRARFEREARSIAALSHPNICAIFDVGEAADPASPAATLQYLVLELLSGQTLAERIARGPLPIADVLRIGGDIAGALDAAHRAGIVHRDLKPGNVFLGRSTGREPTTKVLDFGLARLAADPVPPRPDDTPDATTLSVDTPLTALGSLVGTVQYMAPEQVEGRTADARSDIFALGAVLYEMTTGRRAFEGKSSAAVVSAILKDHPPPIGRSQPLAPAGFERLVQACLAKDPDARPQSAHDVRLQLGWLSEVAAPEAIADAKRPASG